MNKVITIDGVKHMIIEVPKPKYKVGDWVKVIANKTDIQEKDSYIGKTFKITEVFEPGGYARKGDDTLYAYGIGEIAETYVVFEDELEPAEEPKPKSDPFDIRDGEVYYRIWHDGTVSAAFFESKYGSRLAEVGNACKDEAAMKQQALREILGRLLWRASVKAGELDNKWDDYNAHYYVRYIPEIGNLGVDGSIGRSIHGVCYFPTRQAALSAINKIIKPFMAEHPDFVW